MKKVKNGYELSSGSFLAYKDYEEVLRDILDDEELVKDIIRTFIKRRKKIEE